MRLLLFLLLVTLSCCSAEPTYFAPQLIEKLAHNAGAVHVHVDNVTPLYVRTDMRGICRTTVGSLYRVYQAGYTYQYATFPAFLADALNQRLAVASSRLLHLPNAHLFPLDTVAALHYARLTPEARVATLYRPMSSQRWTLKPEVASTPDVETALYYLFLGNYDVGFDDYRGQYIITKGVM
ncbi:hypothetical protein [Hymenobacter metallicola]|uniref:Uncharacterized protein n=1 Tax=Hymenobacter metallicola TaxID=2563114 RepID=A0A4Z0PVV3_9BACT|nr:hypothetical protein [Hymenobacter metallicola]TGE20983.1 hypothetical protein E5K02_24785 [Hymenobacter metallicola]